MGGASPDHWSTGVLKQHKSGIAPTYPATVMNDDASLLSRLLRGDTLALLFPPAPALRRLTLFAGVVLPTWSGSDAPEKRWFCSSHLKGFVPPTWSKVPTNSSPATAVSTCHCSRCSPIVRTARPARSNSWALLRMPGRAGEGTGSSEEVIGAV